MTPERDGYLRAQKVFEALAGARLDIALTVLLSTLVLLARGGNVSRARLFQELRREWANPSLEAEPSFRPVVKARKG